MARQLVVAGPDRPRLDHVNLSVRPGEIHVLIGPNGAGKSTLHEALAGAIPPDSGSVLLDQVPLENWSLAELARRRAALPQDNPLAFDFNVAALVDLGGHPFGPDEPTAKRLGLKALNLGPLLTRGVRALSGGERQRAQLARVLAQTVPAPGHYLLLDEPLGALDLQYRAGLLGVVSKLAADGVGVVLTVHELDALAHLDASIHLMHAGRIIEVAPALEAFSTTALSEAYGGPVHFEQRLVPTLTMPGGQRG